MNGIRLGVIDNYTFRDVDKEVADAVHLAVDQLAKLGAEIRPVKIPLLGGRLGYSFLFSFLLYEFNQWSATFPIAELLVEAGCRN